MKRSVWFVAVVGALVGAFALGQANGQDQDEKQGGAPDMAAWMEIGQPGTETEKGKVWEYLGSFFGPGGVEVKCRNVLTKRGEDEQLMEMYCDFGTGEFKTMEMVSTRTK